MCIGLPARVVSANAASAVIESFGVRKVVGTGLAGTLKAGDFVTVLSGNVFKKLTQDEYHRVMSLVARLAPRKEQ